MMAHGRERADWPAEEAVLAKGLWQAFPRDSAQAKSWGSSGKSLMIAIVLMPLDSLFGNRNAQANHSARCQLISLPP